MRFLILNTTKWRQLATNCEEFETIIHKNLIEKLIYNIQFLCLKCFDQRNHGKWKYLFDWQQERCEGTAIFRGNLNRPDRPNT